MKSKLITLKQAVELLNQAYGIDPAIDGRPAYAIGTLYNAIAQKKLKRYGPTHLAQVDSEELLRVYGPKKGA